MSAAVPSIVERPQALTPYLICHDAEAALGFCKEAFGAVELSETANAHGRILNAVLLFEDTRLMLMDEFVEFVEFGALGPNSLGGSSVTIYFRVKNVDEVVRQATAAGAAVKMAAKDEFWGDRVAVLEDSYGHSWSLASHTRDVGPARLADRAKSVMTV